MLLDYNSLLLAVGFSAACLSLTLFGTWLTARSDKFLDMGNQRAGHCGRGLCL